MSLSHTNYMDISLEKTFFETINELKTSVNSIKSMIQNVTTSNIHEKINEYFIIIYNIIDKLININKENNIQNESIQRKNEEKIRLLYGKIFNKKLMNEILENKIANLTKKEKEFELLKQKTGAIVCNGQVICNERKDNEIIILRTENSLLKCAIKNNEDLLKEKNDIINGLNKDIAIYKSNCDELNKIKHGKYSSFSNINININESDCSQKKSKNKKPLCGYNNNTMKSLKSQNLSNNSSNGMKNIYSTYQMNSQLINRLSKNINKNIIENKEDLLQYYSLSKNKNEIKNKNKKKESMSKNKTNSIKYISVNKSLFSPKYNKNNKLELNTNDNKTIQTNKKPITKMIINDNFTNGNYNTITLDSKIQKKVKIKKIIKCSKIYNKHNKSNSENSLKQLMMGNKQKSLSNENDRDNKIYSSIRRLSQIKNNNNQTIKKNNKSLPPSILTTITEGFIKNKKMNKCLANCLMSYTEKNRDNKGRNTNNYNDYNIVSDLIKDNTLSFMQNTFMNRTISDYNDKNCINGI